MENTMKMYVTADEAAQILGVSRGYAYKIIRGLNNELKEKGYRVISGKVPTKYFEEKFYGMQTMLRLVGFGDNAGSGFPTILDVWKSEGWIKPELIEDTNLDQVTLVMKMEKESDDGSAEKSAESAEKSADSKKMKAIDLSERQKQILAYMDAGVEYSTEQVAEKIGLKGPRTRQLLNELVNMELLACIGTTKRRRYIKV
jgi:predicted HTH transcriptional regulator